MARKRKNKSKQSGNHGQTKPTQPLPSNVINHTSIECKDSLIDSSSSSKDHTIVDDPTTQIYHETKHSNDHKTNETIDNKMDDKIVEKAVDKSDEKAADEKTDDKTVDMADDKMISCKACSPMKNIDEKLDEKNHMNADEKLAVDTYDDKCDKACKKDEVQDEDEKHTASPVMSPDTVDVTASSTIPTADSKSDDDDYVKVSHPSKECEEEVEADVKASALKEALEHRGDPPAYAGKVSPALMPTVHTVETHLRRQSVKAAIEPRLAHNQQESTSDSPYSKGKREERAALGIPTKDGTAPSIASTASNIKTKIAGQEYGQLAKKVARRPSAELLLKQGIVVETGDALPGDGLADPSSGSYTPAPAPSPASGYLSPSWEKSQRAGFGFSAAAAPERVEPASSSPPPAVKRKSFTATAEYAFMESLPAASNTSEKHSSSRPKQKNEKAESDGYRPYKTVERRVVVGVTLKVLTELRKRSMLDNEAIGNVKEKLFDDDTEIVKAVEGFVSTKNLEKLIEVIYTASKRN